MTLSTELEKISDEAERERVREERMRNLPDYSLFFDNYPIDEETTTEKLLSDLHSEGSEELKKIEEHFGSGQAHASSDLWLTGVKGTEKVGKVGVLVVGLQ